MIQVCARNIEDVWFGLACAEPQVFATSFGESEQEVLGNLLDSLPFNVPFQVYSEPLPFAQNALSSLKTIYDGEEKSFHFALAIEHLPVFTQRALKATRQIPAGYVTSYGSIAKVVGGGPRAVGNVMANNAFAPLVPCHRVVKSDFTLGGYGGGLKVKYQLLCREKRGFTAEDTVNVEGKEMSIYPAEFALKRLDSIFSR